MAVNAESIGVSKVSMPLHKTMALAILAGAFIAFGAAFFVVVTANSGLSEGITRFFGGVCFSLGLILVILGGAELFTGNNLIVMAWANKKVSSRQMLKNWLWVYIGNTIGAVLVAFLMFLSKIHYSASGQVGIHILNIAKKKCGLGFIQAMSSGILCNILVCLAVWLCFSSKSVSGKILSILFPISAFVTLGFEHSIANLYFVPEALFILKSDSGFMQQFADTSLNAYSNITLNHFLLDNLIPVTLGNIIGGGVLVGITYWFVYLKKAGVEAK